MCSSVLKNCHTLAGRVIKEKNHRQTENFWFEDEWMRKKASGEDGIKIEKIINSGHVHDSIPSRATSWVPQQTKEMNEMRKKCPWSECRASQYVEICMLPSCHFFHSLARILSSKDVYRSLIYITLKHHSALFQCAIICVYKPHSCTLFEANLNEEFQKIYFKFHEASVHQMWYDADAFYANFSNKFPFFWVFYVQSLLYIHNFFEVLAYNRSDDVLLNVEVSCHAISFHRVDHVLLV